MFERVKQNWRQIKSGMPGRRFQDHYQRQHQRAPSLLHRVTYGILGIGLLVGGVLLSIPPGVPGTLVALLGIGVISTQSSRAARVFDWTELRARQIAKGVVTKISR